MSKKIEVGYVFKFPVNSSVISAPEIEHHPHRDDLLDLWDQPLKVPAVALDEHFCEITGRNLYDLKTKEVRYYAGGQSPMDTRRTHHYVRRGQVIRMSAVDIQECGGILDIEASSVAILDELLKAWDSGDNREADLILEWLEGEPGAKRLVEKLPLLLEVHKATAGLEDTQLKAEKVAELISETYKREGADQALKYWDALPVYGHSAMSLIVEVHSAMGGTFSALLVKMAREQPQQEVEFLG